MMYNRNYKKGAKRMNESFNVKLVEDVKSYTPDPRYKKKSWLGDYQNAYNEFLKDQDAFWGKMAQNSSGSSHGTR